MAENNESSTSAEHRPTAPPSVARNATPASAQSGGSRRASDVPGGQVPLMIEGEEFYCAPHGSDDAHAIRRRTHPRSIGEGDPHVREYQWAGMQAFECRYPVRYADNPEDPSVTWKLACCKTFFTEDQLRAHWVEEHNDELPPLQGLQLTPQDAK